jgi:hypothetical protein
MSYQSSQYRLLTVKDVQQDESSIIDVLSAIKADELSNDLVLLNYYKEIPVSFGATIERIEGGVVDMIVHRLQALSMQLEMTTFIKSDHLPYCVIAKVLKVKNRERLAFLTHFAYVQIPAEQRKYVRVKVLGKVDTAFCCDNQEVNGTVAEISFGGVAILAPQLNEIRENAKGIVTLSLPSAKLNIPGAFLRVEEQSGLHKYIIKLETDPKSEKIISKFIFHEQIGILREMKNKCI